MKITYCRDSINKWKHLYECRLLPGRIDHLHWATLQRLSVIWCWNAARCVNVTFNTVTHFCCWQSSVISFTAIRPKTAYKQSISHYVFTRSTLILCLPDFKNNLVQPQSISPRLIYSSIFPFGFLLHCGPLKIGLHHLSDHSRGGRCFLSNDGSVHALSRSPPGIWDREREHTWRARWGPSMRACNSSSNWLRRECCCGERNRYTVFWWRNSYCMGCSGYGIVIRVFPSRNFHFCLFFTEPFQTKV